MRITTLFNKKSKQSAVATAQRTLSSAEKRRDIVGTTIAELNLSLAERNTNQRRGWFGFGGSR